MCVITLSWLTGTPESSLKLLVTIDVKVKPRFRNQAGFVQILGGCEPSKSFPCEYLISTAGKFKWKVQVRLKKKKLQCSAMIPAPEEIQLTYLPLVREHTYYRWRSNIVVLFREDVITILIISPGIGLQSLFISCSCFHCCGCTARVTSTEKEH